MEDLKIVLYILVAIGWIIYRNYQKLGDTARKRDIKSVPKEVIRENWPRETKPKVRNIMQPVSSAGTKIETVSQQKSMTRVKMAKPQTLKTEKRQNFAAEGGNIKVTEIVQFEDAYDQNKIDSLLPEEIKIVEWRRAIVLSEILNRPYN